MKSRRQEIKGVKVLLPATKIDMGGFPVKQALPTQKVERVDPFLLLHHATAKFNINKEARHQGVGPHPHRGFSPVTFIVEGEVRHRDSWGNDQIAKAGEVQWMHAGAGIVHSERPTDALVAANGKQEIIQLWINSPSSRKMQPPVYTYLSKEDMPVFLSDDTKISNKLVAGNYSGIKSKLIAQSELLIIWGNAQSGGTQTLNIPPDFSAMIYLIKGKMKLKGFGIIDAENLAVLDEKGEQIEMSFSEDSQFLLLSGKPINEKVTQHGPYVMNTQTEILEAMRDYKMGKMGILIED